VTKTRTQFLSVAYHGAKGSTSVEKFVEKLWKRGAAAEKLISVGLSNSMGK
jgi:hypothetical protein